MITHRDQKLCSSAGHSGNREFYRWLYFGADYELPISLADMKDSELCEGYIESSDPLTLGRIGCKQKIELRQNCVLVNL